MEQKRSLQLSLSLGKEHSFSPVSWGKYSGKSREVKRTLVGQTQRNSVETGGLNNHFEVARKEALPGQTLGRDAVEKSHVREGVSTPLKPWMGCLHHFLTNHKPPRTWDPVLRKACSRRPHYRPARSSPQARRAGRSGIRSHRGIAYLSC